MKHGPARKGSGMLPLVCLACLVLTDCSLRPDQKQPTTYTLLPEYDETGAQSDTPDKSQAQLTVLPVQVAPDLKSRRILIKRPGGITDYYAESRWNLASDKLVHNFMKEALAARYGPHIVPHGHKDNDIAYKLQLHLHDFQAEYRESTALPPVVRIAVTARIKASDKPDRGKRLEATQKADANTMHDVRTAFEDALNSVTDQIVEKLLKDRL